MKTINLKEILISKNREAFVNDKFSNYFTAAQCSIITKAMKQACKQTLEIAAENAETIKEFDFEENPKVNKQSILRTINQIE